MLRKLIGSMAFLLLVAGITFADEVRAIITKVDGDKVTFAERKSKTEKGPEQTLPAVEGVKVIKGKFNRETKTFEPGEPVSDGLKNPMFSNIGEKGLPATVVTDDNKKITEIRIIERGKKKQ
jgi:hypothetical protein